LNNLVFIKDILSKKETRTLYFIFFLMIINSFLEAFSIGMLLPLFSLILNSGENNLISEKIFSILNSYGFEPTTELFLISIIFIFLIKYLFTIYYTKFLTSFALDLRVSISSKIFKDYLYKSLIFHSNTSSATLVRNIDKEVGIFLNNFLGPILSYSLGGLTIFFILVLLLLVNFKSTLLLILIFGIIYFLIIKSFSAKLLHIGELRQHHEKFSLKYIYEAIRTIIEVKLLELEDYYKNKYFFHANRIAKQSTMRAIIGILPKIIFESTLLLIICYLIFFYTSNNLSIDDLFAQLLIYATAGFRIMPALNLITTSHQKIKFGFPAAKLLSKTFLNFDPQSYSQKKNEVNSNISFKKNIEFKNLNFSYDNKIILTDFDLTIKKNQTIGIKGKNGSGKTTLVKLICGLLQPNNGSLYVDGQNIDSSSSNWKKLIGYIPQEINLIEGTIKDNLCIGIKNHEFDEKKLDSIIDNIQLREFVNKLPNGLDTDIGELGSKISGGEKQKIGICRALFRDPDILIFDESTSALDVESEIKFIETLNSIFKDKTKIIISHRPGAFKFCDKIYDLNDK